MAEDMFQLRYTVPGLGYFITLYASIATFVPNSLSTQYDTSWLALATIAAVGTVPAGYLINQFALLGRFLVGGYANLDHMKRLGRWIQSQRGSKTVSLYPDGRQVNVKVNDLRRELDTLGKDYLRRTVVATKEARSNIETFGLLAPLHDVMFLRSRAHQRYLQTGWMYSNTTQMLLLALFLAVVPWFFAWITRYSILAPLLVAMEFVAAAGASWYVQRFSQVDADLKENFLTFLYEEESKRPVSKLRQPRRQRRGTRRPARRP